MVLDIHGNIYVTAGSGESGGVYVFSDSGEHLDFFHTPEAPTNCTFGDVDLRTLYVTALTPVYSIDCSEPGYLAYPRS
jgi:gluconolactonase